MKVLPISRGLQAIIPDVSDNETLAHIDEHFLKYSEMSARDREFLNALVLHFKPKKILEIGIAAGASSVVLLNAMRGLSPILFSIDYLEKYWLNPKKETGFIVDAYPDLKANWQKYTGGLALKFMDSISGDIDFVLIDTAHRNPGEILDFLMALPYLSDDAVVVFHDTKLHTKDYPHKQHSITNNLLMSAIYGEKIIEENYAPRDSSGTILFSNIAAVKISPETREHLYEIVNLLTLKWDYYPPREELTEALVFYEKRYGKDSFIINQLRDIFEYQARCFRHDKFKQAVISALKYLRLRLRKIS